MPLTINQATAIRAAHDPEYLQEVLVAVLDDNQRTRDLALAAQTAIEDTLAALAMAETTYGGYEGQVHHHALSDHVQVKLRNIQHALESQAQAVAA